MDPEDGALCIVTTFCAGGDLFSEIRRRAAGVAGAAAAAAAGAAAAGAAAAPAPRGPQHTFPRMR